MIRNDYTLERVRDFAQDILLIAIMIGVPFEDWARQCHAISLKMVQGNVFGPGRVARGAHPKAGQHSWIVLGQNVYDPANIIVDPTLWSYDESVKGILVDYAGVLTDHHVRGAGSIWHSGHPANCSRSRAIRLKDQEKLSPTARAFLDALGPLDREGWMRLASECPMGEWPSGEIIGAMLDTPELEALVPIDIAGMVTDRNPSGLYLAEEQT